MSKNKKVIIGILIAVLIIVIGIVVVYKVVEKNVTDREDFKFTVENISSNPVDTTNQGQSNIKSNRNPNNVIIKVDNATIKPESISITITDNNENQYGWGVEFRVQEKVNGEWKDLNYISDNLSWIDIAYQLNEDKQLTQKLDIEKYYGKLSNGIYRIVKPV
uniref:immunoglobulin-like domain-containing protein n=1 Tax=Romboutsia ilealis TaxID=1115758 RepID=UPI00272CC54E